MYSKEVVEKIKELINNGLNPTETARIIKVSFGLDKEVDAIRFKVKSVREALNYNKPKKAKKRLFYDIETSYYKGNFWCIGYGLNILPHQIEEYSKVICISWKWENEDKVHNLRWSKKQCDKKLITNFIKVLNSADEIVAHNGDRFDEKILRTRAIFHRIPMRPTYKSVDTLKLARAGFKFHSNKLNELGKFLGVGRKIPTEFQLWKDIIENKDSEQLDYMVKYCDQDVLLLEDVFNILNPYTLNKTNYAVLKGGEKRECVECGSPNIELVSVTTTPAGTIKRLCECSNCNKNFYINKKTYQDLIKYKIMK